MLSKHLFQHRYDYRAECSVSTDDGRPPRARPLGQRIVQAVADITDSPCGLLLTRRMMRVRLLRDGNGLRSSAGRGLATLGVRFFEQTR